MIATTIILSEVVEAELARSRRQLERRSSAGGPSGGFGGGGPSGGFGGGVGSSPGMVSAGTPPPPSAIEAALGFPRANKP